MTWITRLHCSTLWNWILILPDVNILLYAHREESPQHGEYLRWLTEAIGSSSTYGLSDLVMSGFLRIVTHPRIYREPSTLDEALEFLAGIRDRPNAVVLSPGNRHWDIFESLCVKVRAKGGLVADAYHAALAIESGAEWITADRDFARFPGLKWRHPLD